MLTLLLTLPLVGILSLVPLQENSEQSKSRMKRIALGISLINFIVSIVMWGEFDSSTSEYQFTQEFLANQVTFCHLNIGVDGISLYFVLLTTFITPICILSNWDNIHQGLKYFLMCFLLLETFLIAVFVVLDILLFYIFFESVLIPLFLIVGIWGGSPTRVRAAFLLFLYTLFGSLFMLLAFLVIYYNVGSTDFTVVALSEINLESQKILWLAIFISMAIKTPVLPFNTWLTYAHSEAPVGGSIVLAGVILKLATYGYMRILLNFLPDACYYFSPLVQTIAIITIIYASLATIRQTDFKKLVAYSSVAHASTMVLGVFSNTVQGIEGAILFGIGHGLVSPALFFLVGGVLYDRYHTRTIRYYRGMVAFMPIFSILFFIFTICNAAVPLSINWVGEFMSLTGIFQQNPVMAVLASSSIVLSAAYSIWLFNRVTFGSFSKYLTYTTDLTRREFMILLPLLLLTVLLGIFPNVVLDNLHASVSTLIYTTNTLPFEDNSIAQVSTNVSSISSTFLIQSPLEITESTPTFTESIISYISNWLGVDYNHLITPNNSIILSPQTASGYNGIIILLYVASIVQMIFITSTFFLYVLKNYIDNNSSKVNYPRFVKFVNSTTFYNTVVVNIGFIGLLSIFSHFGASILLTHAMV